jgi:hypothetical protein
MCFMYALFSPLWEDFSVICFYWCLTLGRVSDYNHVAETLQPMTPTILSEDIIVALRQLHPFALDLVLPPIFLLSA